LNNRKSIGLIVGISLAVGILHFLVGPDYNGPFKNFMTGYLIDILLPMNVYLLGQISLRKYVSVKTSRVLAGLGTLGIGVTVEVLQYLDYHILGETYDPLDLLMYSLGIVLGLVIDFKILHPWEQRN
jgi:hypothetical protein